MSLDDVNRAVWSRESEELDFEGWLDPGEQRALLSIADRIRGEPILDLGVGPGRTVSLLRLLSARYMAIDYTAAVVELCRERHPDVAIELGDARELHAVPDASQALVVFSNNGIDAVDHEDRRRVLASVHRVLRPGGLFLFSTLNKDGPLFGAHPGTAVDTPWEPGSLVLRRPVEPAAQDEGEVPAWAVAVRNWRRLRARTVDAGEWGVAPFAAHRFSLLTHFITVAAQRRELAAHGLEVEAVYECGGAAVPGDRTSALYFHVIARRG
jgi:SAM-dependent methyltransferase